MLTNVGDTSYSFYGFKANGKHVYFKGEGRLNKSMSFYAKIKISLALYIDRHIMSFVSVIRLI